MSSAIRFLEAMGSNASLATQPAADYAAGVALLDIDVQQHQALIDRDHVTLGRLLGGRPKLLCSVFAPDEEPQKEGDQPFEEPDQEFPVETD